MRTIRIYQDKGEHEILVQTHINVPPEWDTEMVLKRFGIGKHLRVYEDVDNFSRSIQPYREWPAERFA